MKKHTIIDEKLRLGKGSDFITSVVYENLKELSYGELIRAIDRLREKMYEAGTAVETADFQYYIELMKELDNRQKEL